MTLTDMGPGEFTVLKLLALDGALRGEIKVSCSGLAKDLDASSQTASRRLQRLEEEGFVERETTSDGQWVAITERGGRVLQTEYEEYQQIFDESPVTLVGTATSGMNEGKHYISLPGYARQFRNRLGYEPFPGTLNVDLTQESQRRRSILSSLDPVQIDGWEDEERTYGPAACHPVAIETAGGATYENAHAIVPKRTHHDDNQLEVIAPVKLRDDLEVDDGDSLTIHVKGN
ncbi:DUF120 domain-containing protein [Saliphagus sp. GCM10025308]